MIKYNEPEFKAVKSNVEDVMTASPMTAQGGGDNSYGGDDPFGD